jgi:hypothetical protein
MIRDCPAGGTAKIRGRAEGVRVEDRLGHLPADSLLSARITQWRPSPRGSSCQPRFPSTLYAHCKVRVTGKEAQIGPDLDPCRALDLHSCPWTRSSPTDQNVRLVFPEIMQSVKNYLSAKSYYEQFGCWRHRRDIRFTTSDVTVNSLSPPIDFESESMRGDYQISPWGLTCRVKPPRAAYYGVVVDFFLEMRGDTLSGLVEYESGIGGPQMVAAVTAALRDTLSREMC